MLKEAKLMRLNFKSLRSFAKVSEEGVYYLDLYAWAESHSVNLKVKAHSLFRKYQKVFEDSGKAFVYKK